MKILFIYIALMFSINLVSQNAIKFDYDAAGNMTQRYIQVISLRLANKAEKDTSYNFNVYPNPAREQIIIEGQGRGVSKEAQVSLYSVNGTLVKQDVYYGTKKSYALSGFSSGIYFLEIKYSEKEKSNYRIIITE
jgi:hypothetical protein